MGESRLRRKVRRGVSAGVRSLPVLLQPARRAVRPGGMVVARSRPGWFRHDLALLCQMLRRREIGPRAACHLRLADTRRAHEFLGRGSLDGKVVLVGAREPTAVRPPLTAPRTAAP